MATTAQQVFDTAVSLMDEISETGATDTEDTAEYKRRTLYILNLLRGELYPFSDTYEQAEAGKRPIVGLIQSFEDEIGLDDYICQSVMPHGLAAYLLLDENPTSASFFNQRYEELKASLTRGISRTSEDIEDVYGGLRYNEFAYW
ncbi:MAG: hypothetical protein IKR93_05235 [Firmicutes bacterium]|nr:hypothetical protein [Bacillota bacterium]